MYYQTKRKAKNRETGIVSPCNFVSSSGASLTTNGHAGIVAA